MFQAQDTRRRFAPGLWYQRLPCDPPPADLARRLTEANVASKAAKRIDSYERYHSQHVEHRRAVVRGVLGAAGLVLSIAPGVPSLISACGHERDLECGLRVMAMAGGALALTVTGWAFWDLYHQPSRMGDQVAKLNAEMARSMQAKNGDVAVERLFDLYRSMSRVERDELKGYLHERASDPARVAVGPGSAASAAAEGAPLSAIAADDDSRANDGDDEGLTSSAADEGSPRWQDALAHVREVEEAISSPRAVPPPLRPLAPLASSPPWHGVTLRRAGASPK